MVLQEKLEVYDLDDNLLGIEDRKDYYDDIRRESSDKGAISKKVEIIRLMLMNSKGRIYLQKRSSLKDENPNLYDKSIGGHVTAGDTYDLTMVKECVEELGFPATVLSEEDFKQAMKSVDLSVVGVLKKIDYVSNFQSIRIINGKTVVQPQMTTVYIGYYDGPVKFSDGESSGIEVFSLSQLALELKNNPDKFTKDIEVMIEKYKEFLKPKNDQSL